MLLRYVLLTHSAAKSRLHDFSSSKSKKHLKFSTPVKSKAEEVSSLPIHKRYHAAESSSARFSRHCSSQTRSEVTSIGTSSPNPTLPSTTAHPSNQAGPGTTHLRRYIPQSRIQKTQGHRQSAPHRWLLDQMAGVWSETRGG
jgi:hypothetical protein